MFQTSLSLLFAHHFRLKHISRVFGEISRTLFPISWYKIVQRYIWATKQHPQLLTIISPAGNIGKMFQKAPLVFKPRGLKILHLSFLIGSKTLRQLLCTDQFCLPSHQDICHLMGQNSSRKPCCVLQFSSCLPNRYSNTITYKGF